MKIILLDKPLSSSDELMLYTTIRKNTPTGMLLPEETPINYIDRYIIWTLNKLITEDLSNDLNLTNLKTIYVTNNMFDQIVAYQKNHNLPPVGCGKTVHGDSSGKMIQHTNKDGGLESVVFLHANVIRGLFSSIHSTQCINIIHHELCHAHDFMLRKDYLHFPQSQLIRATDLPYIMSINSELMLCEYIACRLSARTLLPTQDADHVHPAFSTLLDLIPNVEKSIEGYVKGYNTTKDLPTLLDAVEDISFTLFQTASSLSGSLHGLADPELTDYVNTKIATTAFYPYWEMLNTTMQDIYTSYPKVANYLQLTSITNVILAYWDLLGVTDTLVEFQNM